MELQQAQSLVYLVAPVLRFQPATDELLEYLSLGIQVVRVGLPENWRKVLRVVIRQGELGGKKSSEVNRCKKERSD